MKNRFKVRGVATTSTLRQRAMKDCLASCCTLSGAMDRSSIICTGAIIYRLIQKKFHTPCRPGDNQGQLPVNVTVTGQHSIPCQGSMIEALLSGNQFLASNRSDAQGTAQFMLSFRQPPGTYQIVFALADGNVSDRLSLQVRGCLRGEVQTSPGTCQVCRVLLSELSCLAISESDFEACCAMTSAWTLPISHALLACDLLQHCSALQHSLCRPQHANLSRSVSGVASGIQNTSFGCRPPPTAHTLPLIVPMP